MAKKKKTTVIQLCPFCMFEQSTTDVGIGGHGIGNCVDAEPLQPTSMEIHIDSRLVPLFEVRAVRTPEIVQGKPGMKWFLDLTLKPG